MGVYKRPGMYIGATDADGLHHLIWEVVDNSIDEAMVAPEDGGVCDRVDVTLNADGSVTVEDNGRGIPVKNIADTDTSALEAVLCNLHAGGKMSEEGERSYKISGGLHGVGIAVVNALSLKTVVEVKRDKGLYRIECGLTDGPNGLIPGDVKVPVHKVKGLRSAKDTGTKVTFTPNMSKFGKHKFSRDVIARRLRDSSYLNPGVTIVFKDKRNPDDLFEKRYYSESGIKELVRLSVEEHLSAINDGKSDDQQHRALLEEPIVLHDSGGMRMGGYNIALQWCSSRGSDVSSFTNSIRTKNGGVHVDGAIQGIRDAITKMGRMVNKLGEDEKLDIVDIKSGLHAVIAAQDTEPQFKGQAKEEMSTPGYQRSISTDVSKVMWAWIENNPAAADEVLDKAIHEMAVRKKLHRAALAEANKSAKGISAKDVPLVSATLHAARKKDPKRNELYIVEGKSAGGSAEEGRDADYQAILPLRGKIINALRYDMDKVYRNAEVHAIITALGTGTEDSCDPSKCRYRRVILMADADPDGDHITNLLLILMWKLFKPLFYEGVIYIARTPLYAYRPVSGERKFFRDDAALEAYRRDNPDMDMSRVKRYKGLGEMDAVDLADSAMDPRVRDMERVDPMGAEDLVEEFMYKAASNVKPKDAAEANRYRLSYLVDSTDDIVGSSEDADSVLIS